MSCNFLFDSIFFSLDVEMNKTAQTILLFFNYFFQALLWWKKVRVCSPNAMKSQLHQSIGLARLSHLSHLKFSSSLNEKFINKFWFWIWKTSYFLNHRANAFERDSGITFREVTEISKRTKISTSEVRSGQMPALS